MATSLYLMPTHRCNCACTYCYLAPQEKLKDGDDAFFQQVLSRFLAEQEDGAPGLELRFIGGEPLLKAELVADLSRRFLARHPTARVVVNTNGTLITEAYLDALGASGAQVEHIVSLDGPPAIHDARRLLIAGGSAFSATLAGLRALQARGLPRLVNAVLDPHSAQGLAWLMSFVRDALEVSELSLSLLHRPDAPLSVAQRYELLAGAYATAELHEVRVGGHHRLLLGHAIPELRCRAGEKTVVVTCDGRLNACQRFVGSRESGLRLEATTILREVRVDHAVASCCYGPETRALGELLLALYRARYPHYLEVHALDRRLFGVI